MTRCTLRILFLLVFVALFVSGTSGQEKPKPGSFITAEEAGPDFKVQGEYEGEITGKGKLGAQVVARGDGKFDVVFLPGGLPGAGWDAQTRHKSAGKTEGDKTLVTGKWSGEIASGKLTGKTADGDAFTLKRWFEEVYAAGIIPVSLIRLQVTGQADMEPTP